MPETPASSRRGKFRFCAAAMTLMLAFCASGEMAEPVPAAAKPVAEVRVMIRSDIAIQLSTAWVEAYHRVNPHVIITARGQGTGGSCAYCLMRETDCADICMSAQKLTPAELEKIRAKIGESR